MFVPVSVFACLFVCLLLLCCVLVDLRDEGNIGKDEGGAGEAMEVRGEVGKVKSEGFG